MSKDIVQINSSEVDNLLNVLDDDDLKRNILFQAVKAGGKVLQDTAKNYFKSAIGEAATHYSKYIRKPFADGISLKGDKAYIEATVTILNDFRMKFFEKGTKQRQTKGRKILGYQRDLTEGWNGRINALKRSGKGHSTGAIKATYFFRQARDNSDTQINEAITQSITNAFNKLIRK